MYCQCLKPEDFTDECYRVSTYKKVYANCIIPINGRSEWAPTGFQPLLPPLMIGRQVGRPKKARWRQPFEPVQKQKKRARGRPTVHPHRAKRNQETIRCSKCHQTGHNRRGCKNEENATNEEDAHRDTTNDENQIGNFMNFAESQVIDEFEVSQVINGASNILEETGLPMHEQKEQNKGKGKMM